MSNQEEVQNSLNLVCERSLAEKPITDYDCTQISQSDTKYYYNLTETSNETFKYTFKCFEIDTIWGVLTLVLVFLAGFWFSFLHNPRLNTKNRSCFIQCTEKLLFMLFFPLIFLFVKFANIFQGYLYQVRH